MYKFASKLCVIAVVFLASCSSDSAPPQDIHDGTTANDAVVDAQPPADADGITTDQTDTLVDVEVTDDGQSGVDTDADQPADGGASDVQEAGWDAPYSVVTWNVGLAYGYVPYAEERRAAVLEALGELDDHVVCLQEVWTVEDREAVRSVLESSGYTVEIYETTGTGGGCSEEEVQPLLACIEEFGCETHPDGLVGCVTGSCPTQLAELSSGCLGCLTVDLTRALPDMMTNCLENEEADGFAFSGHNGLVLATKDPETVFGHGDFEASLTWRSYITATIPKLADCDPALDLVVCTHLTADLSNVPYTGSFGSYEAENAQQVDQLLAQVNPDQNVILLGDFNTGPELPENGLTAELPDNFTKFTDAGWITIFTEECTWCPDGNALLTDGAPDRVIDHILLSPSLAASSAQTSVRVMDQGISIEDQSGEEMSAHLSDHFGVRGILDKDNAAQ